MNYMSEIKPRVTLLTKKLRELLNLESISFNKLTSLKSPGVYVLFDGDTPIYAGKTTRKGKKRLREMAADFRSHTLNRKMLIEQLNAKHDMNISKLSNTRHKEKLISNGKITKEKFQDAQSQVNEEIRKKKIKFLEADPSEIDSIEHFVIGVLSPRYND